MNPESVTPEREYLVFNSNFTILDFSPGVQKYANTTIGLNEDVRAGFPELIGLETTCEEIQSGRQKNFSLNTIFRNKQSREFYFNLLITATEEHLAILLEDVTESTRRQQSSMQKTNEAEITLERLQRFEYCTNKIIASMRDVLLIVSPQGRIERVNKSTTELFQQKKVELLGQLINDVIVDPNFDHQKIYRSLLTSTDTVRKIEVNCTAKQERVIQIEFDCFVAPTEVKNFFNCVYIGRDITARKQAEAEIRKALAREKELKELKSGFISMASHEFRNPLSSILLCVQNLSENFDLSNSEREFYLQSIRDAALTMNSLLEDILILSKAESNKQQLKLETINLPAFCLKIIEKLISIYAEKQVKFNYQAERELFDLDKTSLRNILDNLLSNALKYSPANTAVELIVTRAADSMEITIEVRDRGIGIPQEAQKHLFESFYRAGNVNSIPGTGLGLAIVKKSVDLYGGSITIDSKLHRGTNIKVTLPLQN